MEGMWPYTGRLDVAQPTTKRREVWLLLVWPEAP